MNEKVEHALIHVVKWIMFGGHINLKARPLRNFLSTIKCGWAFGLHCDPTKAIRIWCNFHLAWPQMKGDDQGQQKLILKWLLPSKTSVNVEFFHIKILSLEHLSQSHAPQTHYGFTYEPADIIKVKALSLSLSSLIFSWVAHYNPCKRKRRTNQPLMWWRRFTIFLTIEFSICAKKR